jgi:hypothetical protein
MSKSGSGRFARLRNSLTRSVTKSKQPAASQDTPAAELPLDSTPIPPAMTPNDFDLTEFHRRKQAMIDSDFATAGGKPLSETPSTVEQAAERFFAHLVDTCQVDPSQPFLLTKEVYTNSTLFKTMTTMPKGAILHTHGVSTVDFAKLTLRLCQDVRAWVWEGPSAEDESVVHRGFEFSREGPPALPKGATKNEWVNCAAMYAKSGETYRQQLESYITMDKTRPSTEGWDMLKDFWSRVGGIVRNATIWFGAEPEDGLLWTVFEDLLATGVTYVEIKEVISMSYYDIDKPEKGEFVYVQVDEFVGLRSASRAGSDNAAWGTAGNITCTTFYYWVFERLVHRW